MKTVKLNMTDQPAIDAFFASAPTGRRLMATIHTHDGKTISERQTVLVDAMKRHALLARFDMAVNGTAATLKGGKLYLNKIMAFAPSEYAVLFYA